MTYTPPEDHDPNIQDPRLGYRIDSGALPVPPDQPAQPVQSRTSSMSPARVAPQEVSSADALLLEQARNVGIPVIENPHHELDPGAVRAIPEETGVLGVGYHDGFLIVAWPRIPRPVEIDEVQSLAGMPIRVAVATESAFQSLWQQADIARKTHLSLVEDILEQALKNNGSDIHLSVGSRPLTRVGGHLAPLEGFGILTNPDLDEIVEYLAGPEPLREGFSGDLDFACTYGNWRFRANVFLQRDSLAVSLRVIPNAIPPMDSLGLPETMKQFSQLRQGIVLVCGPTGSGKSTSLASLINKINYERDEHIITIEDPIEYIHASQKSLIQQREVGGDTKSFAMAMRSVLRQDPDVILVGEMRDLETISTALTAAETGHLVFSTLHATDAAGVIDRIIDAFPKSDQSQIRAQLANTLEGIVCQSLLPRADDPDKRVAICELMVATAAVRSFIREGHTHQIPSAIQTGIEEFGMVPRDLSLAQAVVAGDITDKVARELVRDPGSYREYLNKVRQSNKT